MHGGLGPLDHIRIVHPIDDLQPVCLLRFNATIDSAEPILIRGLLVSEAIPTEHIEPQLVEESRQCNLQVPAGSELLLSGLHDDAEMNFRKRRRDSIPNMTMVGSVVRSLALKSTHDVTPLGGGLPPRRSYCSDPVTTILPRSFA